MRLEGNIIAFRSHLLVNSMERLRGIYYIVILFDNIEFGSGVAKQFHRLGQQFGIIHIEVLVFTHGEVTEFSICILNIGVVVNLRDGITLLRKGKSVNTNFLPYYKKIVIPRRNIGLLAVSFLTGYPYVKTVFLFLGVQN